jgi:hypothetical protein
MLLDSTVQTGGPSADKLANAVVSYYAVPSRHGSSRVRQVGASLVGYSWRWRSIPLPQTLGCCFLGPLELVGACSWLGTRMKENQSKEKAGSWGEGKADHGFVSRLPCTGVLCRCGGKVSEPTLGVVDSDTAGVFSRVACCKAAQDSATGRP